MPAQAPYHPIIYIRGFAATMSEIEGTVATPYMGFNLGATKLRQTHDGKPVRFIFESPLIRLFKDHGYRETYHQGDLIDKDYVESLDPDQRTALFRSVWIFRYYEEVSEDLGSGNKRRIPEFAEQLRQYILQIRDLLCATAAEKRDFRVYLVAHSMGGLIARCYLQNIAAGKKHYVDKVFTYATPHNGIEIMGANTPNLEFIDKLHVGNFNRKYMREYLKITGTGDDANSLNNRFDAEKFFCLVGTNFRDYDAFFGLAKRGTGEMSDGLVMMHNAYVAGAPRAYAHRSHSGHYGIVNSEEGYQNLTRFLFGRLKVTASLETDDITLPKAVYERLLEKGKPDFSRLKAAYYIESTAMVRGEKYNISERVTHQCSALRKEYNELLKKRLILFTGFLRSAEQVRTVDGRSSFAIRLGVQVPVYEIDRKFWFDAHYEGQYILWETVVLSYDGTDKKRPLTYRTTAMTEDKPAPVLKQGTKGGAATYRIPLGFDASLPEDKKPAESFSGALVLEVGAWNDWQ